LSSVVVVLTRCGFRAARRHAAARVARDPAAKPPDVEILYVLIPLGLVLVASACGPSLGRCDGQFDDLDSRLDGAERRCAAKPPALANHPIRYPRNEIRPGRLSFGAPSGGVAASGHCSACAVASLVTAVRNQQATQGSRVALRPAYNLSRITSYALAGGDRRLLANAASRPSTSPRCRSPFACWRTLMLAPRPPVVRWRLLDPLESAGSGCGAGSHPGRAGKAAGRLGGAIGLGLAWGLAPCGMTYSMLLLSASRQGRWGPSSGVRRGRCIDGHRAVAFERIARSLASVRHCATSLECCCSPWACGLGVTRSTTRQAWFPGQQAQQEGHQLTEAAKGRASAAPRQSLTGC